MSERIDVLVIGSGPGGYHAAIRAAQLGKFVVCVDRGAVGGVCINVGCIPTKALLHVGEVARASREAAAIGLRIPSVDVDLEGVRAFADRAVRANAGGVTSLFKTNGVVFVQGAARFLGPRRVAVDARTFEADAIVIATGSEPISISSFSRDGRIIVDSNDAIAVPDVPRDLLVIGGGVVGLELATVYQRLGAHVTIVEQKDEILPGTDRETARALRRVLGKQGFEILTGTNAKLVATTAEGALVDVGGERRFDRVLVAVGRRPVTRGLDLHLAGVAIDERGFIPVDARRQTNVAGIHAIGDVAGGALLAHKAMREGVVAAEAIAGDRGTAYDPIAIPSCVYTDPQLATVGLGEEEAIAAGHRVRVGRFPLSASGRGRTMGAADGLVKLVADERTDLVLGMHVVGPQAESLIGEGVVAIEMRATLEDLALSIHPHPTFTEAIHDAAEAAHGKAIHLPNRRQRPETAPAAGTFAPRG